MLRRPEGKAAAACPGASLVIRAREVRAELFIGSRGEDVRLRTRAVPRIMRPPSVAGPIVAVLTYDVEEGSDVRASFAIGDFAPDELRCYCYPLFLHYFALFWGKGSKSMP